MAKPPTSVPQSAAAAHPLVCFSHLRWDFVLQRPQHIMAEFRRTREVLFWEEPVYGAEKSFLDLRSCPRTGVRIATPHLPHGMDASAERAVLARLLAAETNGLGPVVRWYYTPMMLGFSETIPTAAVVYDCMDELANFRFAPAELRTMEDRLLQAADVVFTGGHSLYEAKRDRHANVHAFPSSIDAAHFAAGGADPTDQAAIPGPRLGFYGVIDERLDLDLIAGLASRRPDWSIVLVGPVAKIAPEDLPRAPNVHLLGQKAYADLPAYLAGWDVALMPFALNEATRFISPTKTPEYLAAGRPVVSTPIRDVVRDYGALDAVHVADDVDAFVSACEAALAMIARDDWRPAVIEALRDRSWAATATAMADHVEVVVRKRKAQKPAPRDPGRIRSRRYNTLVVGAGFAGAVLAERLASQLGHRVLLVDRRPHIGGNAYDYLNEHGILTHRYGPHIFHTNSAEVFGYLGQFTSWRPYEHRVLARVGALEVPIPINRTTLNVLYGLDLADDAEAAQFLAARAETVTDVQTSEDVVIAAVGRELYETFFRGYSRKQWGMDPSELDKSVTARVPTRTNTDDRYFTDRYQAMPAEGYTAMFARMLDHPNIDRELGVDFADVRDAARYDRLIFTGPVDEYFGHCCGRLPYRSIDFRHETLDADQFQSVGTINYPEERTPWTRITEYKHLTGQTHPKTTITYEFPCAEGDPYYPVPRPENHALLKRYEELARDEPGVHFVGRLATYRYYNMDQVVGQALSTFRRIAGAERASPVRGATPLAATPG